MSMSRNQNQQREASPTTVSIGTLPGSLASTTFIYRLPSPSGILIYPGTEPEKNDPNIGRTSLKPGQSATTYWDILGTGFTVTVGTDYKYTISSTGAQPIVSAIENADAPPSGPDHEKETVITPSEAGPTSALTPTSSTIQAVNPTSTTSPDASKPAASKAGLSTGAIAGIAIGCLIAGALLAGLAVWFCLGRSKKRRRSSDREGSALTLTDPREKGPVVKAVSLGSGSPTIQDIDAGLPQPLEDKAISGGIAGISLAIKNHVQSFYHSNRVSPGLLDLDDLQALGELPISTGTLSTLLGNSDTREIALRFCIAWVVISRMQLSSEQSTTFLPPEISQCFQSMAFIDRTSPVHMFLLAKWRAITAELMQSTYVRNSFSATDPRRNSVEKDLHDLEGILQPYADSRINKVQRVQNLREIMKRSANFAFTLFSQPSTWNFDWQEEQRLQSGSLCVFPALTQITDECGEPIKPPRALSEAVVRRLDG